MNLLNRLKTVTFSNLSLLVVVLGAVSNFVLILFLKKYLPDTFNVYSLYLTYLAIIVSFGLIGFDQVLLRLSTIEKDLVVVPKDIFIFILLSGLISPVAIGYYFSHHFEGLPFGLLLLSGFAINSMIMAYNVLRLKKNFVVSQLFQNGYKIAFLLFVALLFLFYPLTTKNIVAVSTLIVCLFSVSALYNLFRDLKISNEKTDSLFNFFLSFSVNMALLTLLSYGERILIVNELGEDNFGKYFYYATVFLFPLTLIQYYVGFKELVFFKEKRDTKMLHDKLKKIFIGGILLVGGVFLVVWIDNGTFLSIDIIENLWLVILLSILGITKLVYGLFSALLGAIAKYQDVYVINLLTAALMAGILVALFSFGVTLNSVVLSLILIFAARSTYIYLKYV